MVLCVSNFDGGGRLDFCVAGLTVSVFGVRFVGGGSAAGFAPGLPVLLVALSPLSSGVFYGF